jgi:5'-phosphate synthase pdxT subunit
MRCSSIVGVKIGVLALQGDVSEHISAFSRALKSCTEGKASNVVAVRNAAQISDLDGLAIPGGESTTISRLIQKNKMYDPIISFEGGIFATCAGMVLMATEVDDPRVKTLSLMDIEVCRNAFGRQRESFEADLDVVDLEKPFHAIFIRAPVATSAGPKVRVLARIDSGIVAATQGRHMALSFHPELGNDFRMHQKFIQNLEL